MTLRDNYENSIKTLLKNSNTIMDWIGGRDFCVGMFFFLGGLSFNEPGHDWSFKATPLVFLATLFVAHHMERLARRRARRD